MIDEGVLVPRTIYDKLLRIARDYDDGVIPQSEIKDNVRPPRRVTITGTIAAEEVGDAVRKDNGTTIKVYNPGPGDATGTAMVYWSAGDEVSADQGDTNPKKGQWEVVAGGGGGAARIRFTILATDFTVGNGALGCDHVVAIVTHVSCGGAGVSVGDEVKIYDPEYCHFNLPIDLLVGLSGTATKMDSSSYQEGLDYILYCMQEIRDDGCIWMIDTLCCSEEEYINVPD